MASMEVHGVFGAVRHGLYDGTSLHTCAQIKGNRIALTDNAIIEEVREGGGGVCQGWHGCTKGAHAVGDR